MFFEALPLKISIVEFTNFYESITGKIPVSLIGEVWFLENLTELRKNVYDAMKRGADMFVAFLLGIFFLFFFPFVALGITLDTRGPIFYRQKRMGEGEEVFETELKAYELVILESRAKTAGGGAGNPARDARDAVP